MSVYQMAVSADVRELLEAIINEMVELFGISSDEAIARINRQWHAQDLSGENEIILHEDEYYWALFIFYGGNVPDWDRNADRSAWIPKSAPAKESGYWPST